MEIDFAPDHLTVKTMRSHYSVRIAITDAHYRELMLRRNGSIPWVALGIVCLIQGSDGSFLLNKRSQHTSCYPGALSPLGGTVDATGTPFEILLEELDEEFGLVDTVHFKKENIRLFSILQCDAIPDTGLPALAFCYSLRTALTTPNLIQHYRSHIQAKGNVEDIAELVALPSIHDILAMDQSKTTQVLRDIATAYLARGDDESSQPLHEQTLACPLLHLKQTDHSPQFENGTFHITLQQSRWFHPLPVPENRIAARTMLESLRS